MAERKDENLEQLLAELYGDGQACDIKKDIEAGDKILELYPAPKPDENVIAEIKAQMEQSLRPEPFHFQARSIYRYAAVAAAILFFVVSITMLMQSIGPNEAITPVITITSAITTTTDIWQNGDISTEDPELAILTEEIQQLQEAVLALRLGENGNGSLDFADDLEMDLIEIETTFWEG